MTEPEITAAIAHLQAAGLKPHWEGGLRARYLKYATVHRMRECVLAIDMLHHPANRIHISRDSALRAATERVAERDPAAKSAVVDEDARLDSDEAYTGAELKFEVGQLVKDTIGWGCASRWDSLQAGGAS